IERALGGRIIGAIARDATEIEEREKPVQMKANDGKDDPPAPDNPPPPRKRGRPRKDEQSPKPEPTGRSRRTSARCPPTCPPPATSAARKTARATKRPGPGTNSTSTWPAAKSRSPAC